MPFRQIVFWTHLVCGIGAGLVIAVMSVTGVALAFEKQLISWAERDIARVDPAASDAPRLSLEELTARFRAAFPEVEPGGITLSRDPRDAVVFTRGRGETYYVNPYTGEARAAGGDGMRSFMRFMTTWHRYLGLGGERRGVGKAVNGVCNLTFFGLAVTGMYIWFPRRWSWSAFRPAIWFNGKWRGKPRDWNWHNVIGFWSAPILIVLTATALPISYQWGGRLINTLTGTPASEGGRGAGRGRGPAALGEPAIPGATLLSTESLFAHVSEQVPEWAQLSVRIPGQAGEAVSFTAREAGSWPRTASSTIVLDPFTGEVISRSGFGDQPLGRQVRSWTRFLHTGEALGYAGQFVAGLASLGGVVLCYTGFALAWRRFFGTSRSS